ncbi:hypothetical protein TWF481_004956 [Arthrobotrys musiformis]|uniref:Ecp2 effector protein domain-containing protein n=1 Tax=Arthrobotrys musiformis TaxID=47236 RepID=A0AAV9WL25_9PEZI
MRFLNLVTALAAANLVASAPAATSSAPSPSTTDVAEGRIIRVKDIDPGHPQGELIIGEVLAVNTTTTEEPEQKLHKRYSTSCYGGPYWVLQDQANRAIGGVCTYMRDHDDVKPQFGRQVSIRWDHYLDSSNTWVHIKDIWGVDKNGNWGLKAPLASTYDWESCFNAFFELIYSCRGTNPDTAGGQLWGYGLGWDSTISWFI